MKRKSEKHADETSSAFGFTGFYFEKENDMGLTCVTITGADDATDPAELHDLWEQYPFVEWGILIGSHTGPRFPSVDWIHRLVEEREKSCNLMRLSLHVCGKFLREIANGRSSLGDYIGPQLFAFHRVQLNWHGGQQPESVGENILKAFCELDRGGFGWDPQLIFQLDNVNNELWKPAGRRFACSGLFDLSHGAGLLPSDWPRCSSEIPCGWAGGLGPENLVDQIPKITEQSWKAQNFWIDMETRVRTEDGENLDLHKVRRCLEIAEPFTVGVITGE